MGQKGEILAPFHSIWTAMCPISIFNSSIYMYICIVIKCGCTVCGPTNLHKFLLQTNTGTLYVDYVQLHITPITHSHVGISANEGLCERR